MQKNDYEEFLKELAFKESSNDYSKVNQLGYLGKYQLGEPAMVDAGYYMPKKVYDNRWNGKFTGVNGVYSKNDFLKNHKAQEDAVRKYHKTTWNQLVANGSTKNIGQTIGGIKITEAALLAGAHLVGAGGVNNYLKSNGKNVTHDANNVQVTTYMKHFNNYDVRQVSRSTNKGNYNFKVPKNEVVITKGTDTVKNVVGRDLFNQTIGKHEDLMNFFEARIYQSMLDSSERKRIENEPVRLTGEMLKNQLELQNDKKREFLQKIQRESNEINKRFTGKIPEDYQNPELENNKIFTKEEIDKMSWSETKKYDRAIRYQKKTIGIPTKQQAAKTASQKGSGLVHVSGYVTASGRRVDDYYRARPVK